MTAVVGAGNVAMDAARCAKRLGADVTVVYRRGEEEIPARKEEYEHAKEEGINFHLLCNPVEILADDKGWVRGLKCIRMELGEPDASGRRSPVATGETVELAATTVICAVGEGIDASLYDAAGVEHDRRGRLAATSTGVEGVWAAGDCRRGPATVVEAIADAAEVARAIAGVDFNKYADCNEQAGREDTCYERKGSLCRDKRNCTKTRCLGCGSVCEVCCDVCPNRANVAIKVPGLVKHQVVHVAQAVRAAEHEKQPRELPKLNERRKRERRERDLAEIQPADIAQVHTKRQQHQNVAHDLQHRAVKKRRQIRARIGEHERRLAQEIGHELKRHELDLIPAQPRRLRRIRQREEYLSTLMLEGIKKIPHVHLLGADTPEQHHGIFSFTVDDVHPHDVSAILADAGIAVRADHHCAQPLLQHLGVNATTRASLAFYNTEAEVEAFLKTLREVRSQMGYAE